MATTSKPTVEIEQGETEPFVVITHTNGDKQKMTIQQAHAWCDKNMNTFSCGPENDCLWCQVFGAIQSLR